MNKISSTKVAEVLRQVGPALRAQQEKIASLEDKIAFYEKKERVDKLASQMHSKNLDPDLSYAEKVDRLMGSDDLDVMEKAIEMSAPQIKLAALTDDPGNTHDAADAFAAGILGD
jgi:hypothetical protein